MTEIAPDTDSTSTGAAAEMAMAELAREAIRNGAMVHAGDWVIGEVSDAQITRILAALADAGIGLYDTAIHAALLSMVEQFAYPGVDREGRPVLGTGGLRSLEEAFAALGWDDPHVVDRKDGSDG